MPHRSISFIVPVRDDAERLRSCLRRIADAIPAGVDVEMVVADNGSTDESVRIARDADATVLMLPGLRVGELRNRAAAAARGEILAFVDADNEIAPEWIHGALDALATDTYAAVGAPYHPPIPATWVQAQYDRLRRHPTAQEPTEWLGTGNMAIRRRAFEDVGGFDTSLETCEDVDLCRKLRAKGYKLAADHRMRNVHHGDPRTLRQVFFGELWRGRDNLRVSLRPPWSGRTLVSAAIPVATLIAGGSAVAGLVVGSVASLTVALAAIGFLVLLVALRAVLMRPNPVGDWPKTLAVAAAYEAGRALALAGRFGHRRRRDAATA